MLYLLVQLQFGYYRLIIIHKKYMLIKKITFIVFVLIIVSCSETKGKNWQMTWNEEFDKSVLDTSKWSKIPRGTPDWQNYMSSSDSCYSFRNGKLILRGIKNTFLLEDTAKYLTGGVYTKDKARFMHGKMSIRAKLNAATGAWPAFWMLPSDGSKWPSGGEIDIMERLNYDRFAYQTVHSNYTVKMGIKGNPVSGGTGTIKPNEFNIYTVIKYANSLEFYINEKRTFTYPRIKTNKKEQFPFDRPFYLLLDMQLGGSWVGKVKDSDLPVEMEIDWVRFYELR